MPGVPESRKSGVCVAWRGVAWRGVAWRGVACACACAWRSGAPVATEVEQRALREHLVRVRGARAVLADRLQASAIVSEAGWTPRVTQYRQIAHLCVAMPRLAS